MCSFDSPLLRFRDNTVSRSARYFTVTLYLEKTYAWETTSDDETGTEIAPPSL